MWQLTVAIIDVHCNLTNKMHAHITKEQSTNKGTTRACRLF